MVEVKLEGERFGRSLTRWLPPSSVTSDSRGSPSIVILRCTEGVFLTFGEETTRPTLKIRTLPPRSALCV